MIRVGILGVTGYTALELVKLLVRHPDVELTVVTSRQEGNPHIAMVHPQLAGRVDLRLENPEPSAVAAKTDCVFSCLPHGASAEFVGPLLQTETRVVDFSADYRLDDVRVYEQWYEQKHPDPQRLGKVVYGLPELFADRIGPAQLVANPGCYPTSAILALAPLLELGWITTDDIIVDSKSGVSGEAARPSSPRIMLNATRAYRRTTSGGTATHPRSSRSCRAWPSRKSLLYSHRIWSRWIAVF